MTKDKPKKKIDRQLERTKSFVQAQSQGYTSDEICNALDLEESIAAFVDREPVRAKNAALQMLINYARHPV
jgi:hypothetical protein